MAEMMKARGVSLPDATGAMKVCFTKGLFESGRFQQMAAINWKWHSVCAALHAESDGEAVFTGTSIKNTVTSKITADGQTRTSTRLSGRMPPPCL